MTKSAVLAFVDPAQRAARLALVPFCMAASRIVPIIHETFRRGRRALAGVIRRHQWYLDRFTNLPGRKVASVRMLLPKRALTNPRLELATIAIDNRNCNLRIDIPIDFA